MAKRTRVKAKPRKTPRVTSQETGAFSDPFEVIGAAPKGKTYQWVAREVLGQSDFAQYDRMVASGWRAVPPKRHPRMQARKGEIVLDGQVLMERSEQLTDAARERETKSALDMIKDLRGRRGALAGSSFDDISDRVVDESVRPPSTDALQNFAQRIQDAKERLNTAGDLSYVEVTIGITVTEREIDTAVNTLNLNVGEYIRRRIIMDTDALVRLNRQDNPAIFQRAEIMIHPKE